MDNTERFAKRLVGEAKFHLRKKLEDQIEAKPVIEIPYLKPKFRKIKENFSLIKKYAQANHLDVSFVEDGTNYLRWEYMFEEPLVFVNGKN